MVTKAPAPTRATSNLTLMFGLVPVPLRLFAAVEESEAVKRHLYTPAGNPVAMPTIDSVTREEISRGECIKMVEVGDKLVELTDDEIAEVTAGSAVDKGAVPIQTFIPLDHLTNLHVTKWYQARPQMRQVGKKKQVDPVADKAFALLLKALEAEKVAALVRVGLRAMARYAILTPDGRLSFLNFDSEVREEYAKPEVKLSAAELKMARQIVKEIGKSTPELSNDAGDALYLYLEKKALGKVKAKTEPIEVPAPGGDLISLLEASVKKAA